MRNVLPIQLKPFTRGLLLTSACSFHLLFQFQSCSRTNPTFSKYSNQDSRGGGTPSNIALFACPLNTNTITSFIFILTFPALFPTSTAFLHQNSISPNSSSTYLFTHYQLHLFAIHTFSKHQVLASDHLASLACKISSLWITQQEESTLRGKSS